MNPLTNENLDAIAALYPELKDQCERSKTSCAAKSALPAQLRSLGADRGLPGDLKWMLTPHRMTSVVEVPPDPNTDILNNILGELKSVRELLSRMTGS